MSTNSYTVAELSDDESVFGPDENDKYRDPTLYVQDTHTNSPIHYNLRTLSYSGLLTFHSCPRKFQLNRLLPREATEETDEGGHLDFGTVVGNGVQELLVTGSMERAIFKAFIDWKDNLESERGAKSSKTFWHAVQAIKKFTEIINGPLAMYELAYFNGKPAVELGFRIDFGNGFKFRGKLDALLIHRINRSYLPLECKTTGWSVIDEAMYGNSAQGVGYGVVIDRVAFESDTEVNSYNVFYPVYMTKKAEWVPMFFPKSNSSRAGWLQSVFFDVMRIKEYAEIDHFPMHGESCFGFNKQCKHYGMCGLSTSTLVGDMNSVPIKLDKVEDYPLEFDVDDLINAQIAKEFE